MTTLAVITNYDLVVVPMAAVAFVCSVASIVISILDSRR